MSPMVSGRKLNEDEMSLLDQKLLNERNQLINLRKHIEKNFEFVGDKFSEKVRDVYYDKETKKSIYGTTTPEEKKELVRKLYNIIR